MRVVVAPDKFKGSLTAAQVAGSVVTGLRAAIPSVEVLSRPVADGGDGTVDAALAAGREELLTAEETAALVAAPAPLAFWRKKRGKTQSQVAAAIGVSQNFLSDLERGKAKGDVTLFAKLARCLDVSIEDLAPDEERTA